jgi:hypothetical protein
MDPCLESIKPVTHHTTFPLWLSRFGPVLFLYVVATLGTDAITMADTADYVSSIVKRLSGGYGAFWEFGHLFWRPTGWATFEAIKGVLTSRFGFDTRIGVIWTLLALNWIAGLICVVALRAILANLGERRWVNNVITIAFIFTHGFLTNAQVGASYIPGLAFLLVGMLLLVRNPDTFTGFDWRSALAGAMFGCAICFWFLYLWAVPAALLSPVLLWGARPRRLRQVAVAALACALFVALAYLLVLGHLGIYTIAGIKEWIASASHGNDTTGLTRLVFGLARSFINMGNDGMMFKRFLIGDVYNPVSFWMLIQLSLWKLVLFYVFLLTLVVTLLRSPDGRRPLALLAFGSLPIICFALLFFDSGSVERYLPLYPFVFVALAYALRSDHLWEPAKYVMLAFIVAATVTNVMAMSKWTLGRQQDAVVARIAELEPLLRPQSKVSTVTWVDDLVNFNRSFPFHPVNVRSNLLVNSLVTPGTTQVEHWREEFAMQTLTIWRNGGDVWVSKQVLLERPPATLNWVEGDDKNVSWTDFYNYFSPLESGRSVGGVDGFMLLLPSEKNRQILNGYVQ